MRLLQPHQMALDTATICDLCDLFPEFSMLHQLVHEARCAISQPSSFNCLSALMWLRTCDKLKQHFPNYVRHHGYEELRGSIEVAERGTVNATSTIASKDRPA
jgi:hypothetical protein